MSNNFFNDLMHSVKATSDKRYADPRDCECIISHREIWKKAPKAMARKATAPGVNWIAIHEIGNNIVVYQVAGYTPDRGLFCDLLDDNGRVIERR